MRKQQVQEAKVEAAKLELERLQQTSEAQQQKVKNEAARVERKYEEALQQSEDSADRNRQRLLTVSGCFDPECCL